MDTLESYRQVIRNILRNILSEQARIPYAYGEIKIEPVFDRESDRYLLMIVGRENNRRVHGCLAHVDIIDGKVWIQRDGTERGIANELVESGIPKDKIVLGFRSPELRMHGEFAVAQVLHGVAVKSGLKLTPTDLWIGAPFRVTTGKKITDGNVELFVRAAKASTDVKLTDVVERVQSLALAGLQNGAR